MSQSDKLSLAVSFKALGQKNRHFVASATTEITSVQLSLTRHEIN